ncbi:branched-chain amino acid ABC transporter permease [Halobacillus halophilus]|uniref:ABC-type transport system permease protein (Probable substrate branched-chain amino acid) n=1 Tax=Halobacillus halophilus (strain ATCC 35676 / DSM 2266 / JCM 20832 / KCTC 3685 / LMG 17431 / NBRC 102448 / NCIMB 2269) TaxID=866895 RepID=I0JID8_HALH3|nr:branched-chain amino acid ABC transporter permease [Halobacillus halophilus]ASF38091.1 branched-chain amino acid ABC transporter permease [Halobacillus halophilus]CCG43906.1 ABC-type transport system permease protein (probable substrate branched-chain amino acid) [Halobacillus halophilus DSM 2266]
MGAFLRKRGWLIGFVLLAVVFPFLSQNDYFLHVLTLAFIWMIAVYGLNLLAGYTGYLSLAHAGFFAIGAYALGLLTVKAGLNYWIALVLACVITSAIGFVVGLVALRTREHFFAIYTLCVGYIIYLVIDKWDSLTGGVRGLIGIPAPAAIGPISFETPLSQYYLILFFLLATIFVMYRIVHSLSGRTFIAIRNSEDLAQTIGISTMKNKLLVFVLSTFFAGLAGALYASFIRFIGPDIGYITIIFDFLTYLLVGGLGTLAGPIVGTFLIVSVSQSLQFLQDYRMLIFGPLLTLLIIFYPRGIAGAYLDFRMKRKAKKKKAVPPKKPSYVRQPQEDSEKKVKEG